MTSRIYIYIFNMAIIIKMRKARQNKKKSIRKINSIFSINSLCMFTNSGSSSENELKHHHHCHHHLNCHCRSPCALNKKKERVILRICPCIVSFCNNTILLDRRIIYKRRLSLIKNDAI